MGSSISFHRHAGNEIDELQSVTPTQIFSCLTALLQPTPLPHVFPEVPGYRIIELLGRGGMSNIYLAEQAGLNRLVALKMIRAQDSHDAELRARFLREASSIAALRHPHIVQIYEVGEAAGTLYLSLEYVPGGSLEKTIQESLPPVREAAEMVRQLADAVQAAHAQDIIHRDLKPANVLLADPESAFGLSGNAPRIAVKVTDFGLARLLDHESSEQTRTGVAVGTPCYMSPEQAAGQAERVGRASDIYGLGAILYELLTGRPPFRGDTSSETLLMVRQDPPIPPRQLNLAVPRDLESICLKCLEKRPERRYGSAGDLAADLVRYLDGLPVSAQPLGPVARCFHYCRRRPWRAAVLVGIPGAVLGVGLGLLVMLDRAGDHVRKERENHPNIPALNPAAGAVQEEIRQLLLRARQDPGDLDPARRLAELGDDWIDRIAAESPRDFIVQRLAGEAYLSLNWPDAALPLLEQAKRLADERTRKTEAGFEAWADLASAHQRLGDVRLLRGEIASAGREFNRAMELRETLYQEDTHERRRRAADLESVLQARAGLCTREKQYLTAVQLHDRRLGLLVEHLANAPTLQERMRETYRVLAELHRQLGNPEAEAHHLGLAERWPLK